MSKSRVVLERFYVIDEKRGEGNGANQTFHALKTMKNEVCSTVQNEAPRANRRVCPDVTLLRGESKGGAEPPKGFPRSPSGSLGDPRGA